MASILATVDIEDLATPKVAGIKDALTDLSTAQLQLGASQSALSGSMTSSAAAMGQVATVGTEAAATMKRLAEETQRVVPAFTAATTGIETFIEAFAQSQQVLNTQAEALKAYIGTLGALAVAAKQGAVPLEVQAAALREMAEAAAAGVPGLAQYAATLDAMAAQVAAGTPLTEAQSVALLQMGKAMTEANAALLDGRTAMERLAAETRATAEAIRESYQGLTLLTSQLKEGTTVTQTQADALKELAAAADAGNGFTKEQAAALAELTTALQAGVTLTKEQAEELETLTEAFADANKETLGLAGSTQQTTTAMQALVGQANAATAAVRENYQVLTLLSDQMREGTRVTELQAAALQELATRAKAGEGFTEAQADALEDVAKAQKAGTVVTQESADALGEVTTAYGEANKATLAYGAVANESIGRVEKLRGSALLVAGAFGLLGAAALHYADEAAKAAARTEVLGVVIQQVGTNANQNNADLLIQVQRIKALGITTDEATEAVIKFTTAQLKATDAAKLARVAQDLAVVAGINSSQAFDRLTRSIEAQSAMMLRSFGIVTGLSSIYAEYARSVGKTTKELDEVEKKQAFLNKILEEGEKRAGTYEASMLKVGKQYTSLARLSEEMQSAIGEKLLPIFNAWVASLTQFYEGFLKLPKPIQDATAALITFGGALATLGAVMSGAKLLGIVELFGKLPGAVKAAGAAFTAARAGAVVAAEGVAAVGAATEGAAVSAGVLKAAWVAVSAFFGGPVYAALALLGIAIAGATALYIAFKDEVGESTQRAVEHAAAVQGEIDKINEVVKTIDDMTVVVDGHTYATINSTEEQEKYNKAIGTLERLVPGAKGEVDALTGAYKLNRDAISEATGALEANFEILKRHAEATLPKTQEDYNAAVENTAKGLDKWNAAMAGLRRQEGQASASHVAWLRERELAAHDELQALQKTEKGLKAKLEAETALVGGLDRPAEAARNQTKALDDATTALVKYAGSWTELEKRVKTAGLQKEFDAFVQHVKVVKEFDQKAGKMVERTMTMTAEEIARAAGALEDKLEDARKAAEKKAEADKKRLQNIREGVTKAVTIDPDELAKFDQLQKELNKGGLSAEEYEQRLWRMKGMLEQFANSAAKNMPQFAQLRANLMGLEQLEAVSLTPQQITSFEALNDLLAATKGNTAAYNAVLRAHAKELQQVGQLTAAHKEQLGDQPELYAAATVALQRYSDELARAGQVKLGEETAEAARVSAEMFRQMGEERIAQEHAVQQELEEIRLRTIEETRSAEKQLEDERAQRTMSGAKLIVYQLQRQNEELLHRYQVEKEQRARALQEERYQTAEKIRLWKLEQTQRTENAIRERRESLQRIADALKEAEIRAKISGDPGEIDRIGRLKAEHDAAAKNFADYEKMLRDQLAMDLERYKQEEAAMWGNVRAHEEGNAQIDAAHRKMVEDQIARNEALIEDQRSGILKWREMWSMVSEAFASGLTEMLQKTEFWANGIKGAWEELKNALIGIWKSLQKAVFSIFEEILKKWIFNLLKMKAASEAVKVVGSIPDMPGEAGGAGGAAGAVGGFAGAAGRGGLFPRNATGAQIGQGALMGGVVGGTVGYGVGYGTGSKAQGALAGAASGAAVGGMYGGWIGAAIGGGIGFLAGLFGGSQAQKDAKKARDEYVKSWSGGLEELKKRAHEVGASLDLAKMLQAGNPEKVKEAIEKIEKALALDQAKKDLAHTEDQLVSLSKKAQLVGYDLTKLYNAKTIEEFNREQEKLNKLLEEQQERLEALGSAAQGLEVWATGFTTTMQKGLQKAFPDAKQAEEFLKAYQDAVTKGFVGTYAEFAKIRRESEGVIASLEQVGTDAQQEFTALGITAAATFAGILKETGDVVQAMNAISPALDKLIDGMDQWGLNADDTFGSLIQFRRIIKDNEDIFQSLGGMTQALKGLSEAGWLTEEAFDAIGRTAVQKFDALVARTGDQRMALMSLQPTLQALWEAQKKYGFSVDESTQALIDQGIEQGIVGANMQSVNQKMLDVLGLIAQQLGVARDKLEAIGLTSEQNSGRVKAGLEDVGDAASETGRHVAVARDELAKLQSTAGAGGPVVTVDPETTRTISDLTLQVKTTVTTLQDAGEAGRGVGTDVQSGAQDAVYGLDAIVRKAGEAEYALIRMGIAGEVAGQQIENAATGAAEGHSPTGIKQITVRIKESEEAMRDFSNYFATQARKIEQASADMVATQEARDLPTMDVAALGVQPVEPVAPATSQTVTIQVTHEAPQISVNALDNANMEEAWRSKIMPEYLRHIDNNADQLAERTEAAISRHRRRA